MSKVEGDASSSLAALQDMSNEKDYEINRLRERVSEVELVETKSTKGM